MSSIITPSLIDLMNHTHASPQTFKPKQYQTESWWKELSSWGSPPGQTVDVHIFTVWNEVNPAGGRRWSDLYGDTEKGENDIACITLLSFSRERRVERIVVQQMEFLIRWDVWRKFPSELRWLFIPSAYTQDCSEPTVNPNCLSWFWLLLERMCVSPMLDVHCYLPGRMTE